MKPKLLYILARSNINVTGPKRLLTMASKAIPGCLYFLLLLLISGTAVSQWIVKTLPGFPGELPLKLEIRYPLELALILVAVGINCLAIMLMGPSLIYTQIHKCGRCGILLLFRWVGRQSRSWPSSTLHVWWPRLLRFKWILLPDWYEFLLLLLPSMALP